MTIKVNEKRLEDTKVVTPCPICGSYSGTVLAQRSSLLAVCDVLVTSAFWKIGKRIIKAVRNRHIPMGNKPYYLAHTMWTPDNKMIEQGLNGAWEVIPAMLSSHGSCGMTSVQVTYLLDQYSRELLIRGIPHDVDKLRKLLEDALGFSFPKVND